MGERVLRIAVTWVLGYAAVFSRLQAAGHESSQWVKMHCLSEMIQNKTGQNTSVHRTWTG